MDTCIAEKIMMNKIIRGVAIAVLLALAGCASKSTLAPMEEEADSRYLGEYKIGLGDMLQVSVWRNPDLSMAVPVRPDGKISIPLVGDVLASGETTEKLSLSIAKELQAYIKNPQVTVIVTSPGSADFRNRIRVTGAVNVQASMPYREGMTVLDVVLDAGGPTEFASGNRSRLYRSVDGEVKVFAVRLDDILNKGVLETNYRLLPGDIITVPERAF